MIRTSTYHSHVNKWLQLVPIEADPSDWAEQQQLAPLPNDDYPHAAELDRLIG